MAQATSPIDPNALAFDLVPAHLTQALAAPENDIAPAAVRSEAPPVTDEAPTTPLPGAPPQALCAKLSMVRDDPRAFLAWLIDAFDVFATPALAAMLASAKEQVVAAGELAANHEDRRVRRRLRDLLQRLEQGAREPDHGANDASTEQTDPAADNEEPTLGPGREALLALVRRRTEGRRVLFVSNRYDADLEAKLTELLRVELTTCDGTLRRVQAQCSRIAQRSYDLVLSATGFQLHGVDSALARASGAAKIPYVRVNRGRPLTVIQSIAREFGLGSAGIARSA
jgi:hypothetical protein